jgi:hypothetical protein
LGCLYQQPHLGLAGTGGEGAQANGDLGLRIAD